MHTKKERLQKIIEVINNEYIERQEQLVERLNAEGFKVTQATVSRDIHDLRLVKEQSLNGGQKYIRPQSSNNGDFSKKLIEVFSNSVINVQYAKNIVVIKTLSGMAQAAASAIDVIHATHIIGSIAGDDTIMVVVQEESDAKDLCDKLNHMRG